MRLSMRPLLTEWVREREENQAELRRALVRLGYVPSLVAVCSNLGSFCSVPLTYSAHRGPCCPVLTDQQYCAVLCCVLLQACKLHDASDPHSLQPKTLQGFGQ
jgi:hypothetical protein